MQQRCWCWAGLCALHFPGRKPILQRLRKNLDQLGAQLYDCVLPKPVVYVDTLGLEANKPVAHLVAVQVKSAVLSRTIDCYW